MILQRYRDILSTNILYTQQSLYELSLYRTDFIRDKVYTGTKFIRGQSLYGDKVYTGQSLYGDKVYTRTKFIQTFFILYLNKKIDNNVLENVYHTIKLYTVCNCYCYCLLIITWTHYQGQVRSEHREHTWWISMNRIHFMG